MKTLTQVMVASIVCLVCMAGPAQAQGTQSGFVEVNGARLHYTSTGSGQPLVLLHGYPLSSDLFTFQRTALADLFRVITVDLRGFGFSTSPTADASIDLYATDILAFMDALALPTAVVGGHSLGGMITLEMYRRAPQRFLGMILIDTTAAPPLPVEEAMWRAYAQQAADLGVDSLLPLLLPEMLAGQTRLTRPGFTQSAAAVIRQTSLNGLVGGATALAERPDLRPVLPTIQVPTLIMVGLEDSLTPLEAAQAMFAAIPNALLSVIPNASHVAIAEKADLANLVIRTAAQGAGVP